MSKINTDRIGTRDGTLDIDVKSIMVRSDALENLGDYEQGIELAHAHEFIVKGDSWYTAKTGQVPYVLTGVWEYDKERLEIYGAWDHSSLKNRNKEGSHSAGAIAYDHGSDFPDKSLGKELQTLKNNSSDYQIVDSFEQGATITKRNQALQVEADGRLYRWAGDLPKTVAAGSSPETTGGAQVGAWLEVSDLTLRQELANPDMGAAMVARGVVAVDSIADLLTLSEGQRKEGLRYLVKEYYSGTGVGGGTFVYSSSNTDVYDGGVSFGKWRRQFDTLVPEHFGVQGSFSTKTLADFYATLSDAQTIFPLATALTDLHDRVAFATYIQYLIANSVRTDWTCQILLDVPLPSYTVAKTTLIDGALELKSHQSYLKYCFHIATNRLVLTGSINVIGTNTSWVDMRTRLIEHGVVCGANTKLGLTGDASNCDLGTIIGSGILGYALAFLSNCHFSRVRQVRGANAGSANNHSTYKYLQGFVDDFTFISSSGGDIQQRSLLQVTDTDIFTKITFLDKRLRVIIDGLPYDVMDIDQSNKQISVYPRLPTSLTTGEMLYVWGGALIVDSNNTACTSAGTCEAIVCGYGLNVPALYGIAVTSFTSEYCGIAVGISNRGEAHLGTTLQLAYFEANKVDILYGWALGEHNALRILQTIALNPAKIHNMFAYTIGETRRRDWAGMGSGEVYLASGSPITVERSVWELHSQSINTAVIVTGNLVAKLAYNPKIAELTGRRQKVVNLVHNKTTSSVVTINAPTGYTVNGGESVTLNMVDYTGVVSVAFYVPLSTAAVLPTDIKVVISGDRKVIKGTTAQRPTNPVLGLRYYDTTLLGAGKPIEWSGSSWIDMTGAVV